MSSFDQDDMRLYHLQLKNLISSWEILIKLKGIKEKIENLIKCCTDHGEKTKLDMELVHATAELLEARKTYNEQCKFVCVYLGVKHT
ncbi:hypothetical protein ACS0TY_031950 [Phlomoides rotata]